MSTKDSLNITHHRIFGEASGVLMCLVHRPQGYKFKVFLALKNQETKPEKRDGSLRASRPDPRNRDWRESVGGLHSGPSRIPKGPSTQINGFWDPNTIDILVFGP